MTTSTTPSQCLRVGVGGPVGSGKTSTLVIAQLKLSTRRVFTLRHAGTQDDTIWHALGRTFDVDPTPEALAKVMGNTRSVMLVRVAC